MAGPFGDMMIMLPMIYLMNQIDWTNEDNIFNVRVGYGLVEILALIVWGVVYMKASSNNDKTKIKVTAAPSFGQAAGEAVEQTITEYDIAQVKKGIQQVVMSLLIVGFIHYKWGIVQPLFLQCVMTPSNLYKNPLVKIYIMGEKGDVEKRPFKEENPFSSLMPQQPEAPANEEPASQEAISDESSEEKATEDKPTSDSSNKANGTSKKSKKPKKDD